MSRYKSYKDAIVLGSKGNSTAGCTALQISSNQTSLRLMQQKRCLCFDVFHAVFASSPNVNPVHPKEVGAIEDEPDSQNSLMYEDEDTHVQDEVSPVEAATVQAEARVPAKRTATQAAGAAPQTAGVGKAAAPFHLAPSKKEKKMDLGEAYLKAQQSRIDSVAASAQAKTRCDLVIALTLQGKTAADIAEFLRLTGF